MSKHRHSRLKEKTPISLMELLEEDIDVGKLIKSIELSEDDLMNAAMRQPELFWNAGRLRVQLMHKRARREIELESARAKVSIRARSAKDDKGKREYTEGHVKAKIELNSEVREIRKKLDKDFVLEELSKQLLEAYRMRRDIIRVITDAGRISLHMKELELMKGNRRLRRAVENIRNNWKNPLELTSGE